MKMITYNVTFIHEYWNLSTTVEAPKDTIYMEVIGIAGDFILDKSGLDVKNFSYVDVDVDYIGEV